MDTNWNVLNQMATEIHDVAKSKGWWEQERSFGDLISLVHSELSEALEHYRDGRSMTAIHFDHDKPDGIPIELADVLIRVLDICGKHSIDIGKAVRIKSEYNQTRSHRHGGKVL